MKTISDINLDQWYVDRELSYIPNHFVRANTPITYESREWILEKLRGRYAMFSSASMGKYSFESFPAFEDPSEATFYELKWS